MQSNTKQIIDNIINENFAEAKKLIRNELLTKVGSFLEEQIEFVAPSMINEEEDDDDSKNKLKMRKRNLKTAKEVEAEKQKEKRKANESYESEEIITPNRQISDDEIYDDDDNFEAFVNEIHEIVQEIEDETGEELTEEEIVQLGHEYLNMLSEELDSDDVIEEELKGNQHKIDANKNGRIDGGDFPLLKKKNLQNKGK